MNEVDKPLNHAMVVRETAITTANKITLATTGVIAFLAVHESITVHIEKLVNIIYEFEIRIMCQRGFMMV